MDEVDSGPSDKCCLDNVSWTFSLSCFLSLTREDSLEDDARARCDGALLPSDSNMLKILFSASVWKIEDLFFQDNDRFNYI